MFVCCCGLFESVEGWAVQSLESIAKKGIELQNFFSSSPSCSFFCLYSYLETVFDARKKVQ